MFDEPRSKNQARAHGRGMQTPGQSIPNNGKQVSTGVLKLSPAQIRPPTNSRQANGNAQRLGGPSQNLNEGQETLPQEILNINMECQADESTPMQNATRTAAGLNRQAARSNADRGYITKDSLRQSSNSNAPMSSGERTAEGLRFGPLAPGRGLRRQDAGADGQRHAQLGGNNLMENANADPDNKNCFISSQLKFIKSENGDNQPVDDATSGTGREGADFPSITLGAFRLNEKIIEQKIE